MPTDPEANRELPPKLPCGIPPLFQDHTFQRFVEGPGNAQALATAKVIAERHGKLETAIIQNVCFIHGRPGLGKTHLMVAIAQAIQKRLPHSRIGYRSAGSFFEELSSALRARSIGSLLKSYQYLDVLLLDNLELLGDRVRTSEEIRAFLNSLAIRGKTVVLAGSVPPEEMRWSRDGLATGCFSGLVTEVNPLDRGGRAAILQRKLKELQRHRFPSMSEDGVQFLASLELPDVRELAGLLNWLFLKLDGASGLWTAERLRGLVASSSPFS